MTPDFSNAVFESGSATISITTNSSSGYSLYMGATGKDSSNNSTAALVQENTTYTIPTLSAASTTFSSTSDTATNNKWGWTSDNNGTDTSLGQVVAGTYNPMSIAASRTVSTYSGGANTEETVTAGTDLVKATTTTASDDKTTVTFGVKVTSDQESGAYSNTILFTAVANPTPLPKMQDMTASTCASLTVDETYEYQDSRDGNVYNVAKLKDGNCWMTENLRLGSLTEDITLTPDDSDVSADWTLTKSVASGDWTGSTTTPEYYAAVQDGNDESYGNYYNWTAAVAMDDSSTLTDDGTEATGSICPKGWRLPSVANSEFQTLLAAYDISFYTSDSTNVTKISDSPLSFPFSGYYYSGLSSRGSYGFWWSSTVYGSGSAYGLYALSVGYVFPDGYGYRDGGDSVRCVAQS